MSATPKPLVLIILDGFGHSDKPEYNAIHAANTPVYDRERLPLDAAIEGPAILEQMDCTTVLEPGDRARSDADGNLIIEVGK